METQRLDSGSAVMNKLLDGGYEEKVITTIFGPAATGKTTLCLLASISAAATKKVIYVDTEGGFSAERLKQLKGGMAAMKNILVLHPTNYAEQIKDIAGLKEMASNKIGLIVVDTISMHYRVEVGQTKEPKPIYSEFDLQVSYLSEIARKHSIPVIITNQVYADFDEKDREAVRMLGGDMLKYSSKCLIELAKYKNCRKAIVKKHRSIPENREILFDIKQEGIDEVSN
jgi:DNA repair protein RadB